MATERFGPMCLNQMTSVMIDMSDVTNFATRNDEMRLLLACIVLSSSELRTVPNTKQY